MPTAAPAPRAIIAGLTLSLALLGLAGACTIDLDRPVGGDQAISPDQGPPPADLRPDQNLCGNGRLDPGELCDTALPIDDADRCPAPDDCPKPDVCVVAYEGEGCQARCALRLITQCVADDGCCPKGCDSSTDGDCPSAETCGDGKPDEREFCDKDCPASCPPKLCNSGQVIGDADTCTARCFYTPTQEGTECFTGTAPGKCYGGKCCDGCWDGSSCFGGTTDALCGKEGARCADCASQGLCCDIEQVCSSCP